MLDSPDVIKQVIPGLPEGYYIQVYLDSGAYSVPKAEKFMSKAKDLGVAGMLWHSTGEIHTPADYKVFSDRTAKYDLLSGVAYGLGLVKTTQQAQGIAQRIAAVAEHASLCAWDMENDDQNVDVGLAMLDEYNKHTGTITIDQPWAMPIPRHHGSPLWPKLGLRMDARCAQFYPNQPELIKLYGKSRIRVMWPKYVAAWLWLNQHYPDCVKPVVPTIQGRGWSDIPYEAVDVLLNHNTLIIWCEAFPSDTMVFAMLVNQFLRQRGFWKPGVSGDDIVKAYQTEYNKTAPETKKLAVDGHAGLATGATMGIAFAMPM